MAVPLTPASTTAKTSRLTYSGFAYTLDHSLTATNAAVGTLTTPHGKVSTPAFIFCATHGSIKAVETHALKALGVQMLLGNTYHLLLRPGAERIAAAGGLHAFMGWDGPLLTDSGGYQIFAMGHGSVSTEIKRQARNQARNIAAAPRALKQITETGAVFRSYVDGRELMLSPERAMEIQRQLGVDCVVQLDECTPYHVSEQYTEQAMERSLRWAARSLAALPAHSPQACYGVLQGGIYPHLRRRSAAGLLALDFFSYAIGGSLGKTRSEMQAIVTLSMEALQAAAHVCGRTQPFPVHLLGIGDRRSIFHGVKAGIATFDCVAPTRMARHGHALMPAAQLPNAPTAPTAARGVLNLYNAAYKTDDRPLDPQGSYEGSRLYTRAYLHHLLKARELAALTILSKHNIAQLTRMLSELRAAIFAGQAAFAECERFWCGTTEQGAE